LRVTPEATSRAPSEQRGGSIRSTKPGLARMRAVAARTWTGHRLFVIVFIPALLLRADAELGYRWQTWFNDSFEYVANTVHFGLDPTRVSGYSAFLLFLEPFHSYAVITILQHLMGLAVGVMIYALARHRFSVPAWLATLAAVPVLYDGYEIELEHLIMADVPFLFVLMLATTVLLWDRGGPSMLKCGIVGLLLGAGAVLRTVGLPLLAIFAVYMIIRRFNWRKVLVTIVVCLVPVFGYAAVFFLEHGEFAMSEADGVFLYSRVMTFAECSKMHVPTDELALCTAVPPAQRPIAQEYIWSATSPLNRYPGTEFSPLPNKLAENFAVRAIEGQPLTYARVVFDDTWRVFAWKRHVFPNAQTYGGYVFGPQPVPIPDWDNATIGPWNSYAAAYAHANPLPQLVAPFDTIIRVYQEYVWVPGTVYGLILLVGLGGMVLAWRRLGGEALLPWTLSAALIVIPAATAEFDYRYVLPAVPFACLAAVIGFSPGSAGGNWLRRLTGATRRAGARPSGSSRSPGSSGSSGSSASSGVPSVSGVSPVSGASSRASSVAGASSGASSVAGASSGASSVAEGGGGTPPADAGGSGDDERDLAADGA
jgi:hypothetical protein